MAMGPPHESVPPDQVVQPAKHLDGLLPFVQYKLEPNAELDLPLVCRGACSNRRAKMDQKYTQQKAREL